MKEKIITVSFLIIIYGFAILNFVIEDRDFSYTERRNLTTIQSLKEDFNSNLEDYLVSQFPFRDSLITLNGMYNRFILGNKIYNGVYIYSDYIIERLYPLDKKSITNFINTLNSIDEKYLAKSNVYYAIIPDKNYFLDSKNNILKIDYDYVFDEIEGKTDLPYINLTKLFDLSDYYKTDIHLRQESYFKVVEELSKYFNFTTREIDYEKKEFDSFYGSSYFKAPYKKAEQLIYLESEFTKNAKVSHLEYEDQTVYKLESLESADAYNIFLSGPSSFIEIINEDSDNERELIIFRDSFASSLAPIMIPYYKKITLIDLRYINMKYAKTLVDFVDKDILFLYSMAIVNDSFLLKN